MRMPGVEPGSQAWEACMMPLHYMRHDIMINLLGRILEDHYSCESLDGSADAPAGAASSRLLVRAVSDNGKQGSCDAFQFILKLPHMQAVEAASAQPLRIVGRTDAARF